MSPKPKTTLRRKRILAALLGVLGLCGGSLAIAVKLANDAARQRVVAACARLREPEEAQMDQWRKLAPSIFAEDTDAALAHLERAWFMYPYCAPIEAELSGFSWNFGRRWQPPAVPDEQIQEFVAIWKRARPRCEANVRDLLVTLSKLGDQPIPEATKAKMMGLCDPESHAKSSQAPEPGAEWPPTLLEGWPTLLETRAASFGDPEPEVEPF